MRIQSPGARKRIFKLLGIIMRPLDMRGLVGAATIMGCLKYGACFSGLDAKDQPVLLLQLKDEDLLEASDDSAFLQSLRISCSRGEWSISASGLG